MNNADREVQYRDLSDERAPVSWLGSGQLRISRALEADFWAYSFDDVQPSLVLGSITAASSFFVQRKVRVINLSGRLETLIANYEFRDQSDEQSIAVSIALEPQELVLTGECGGEHVISVEFRIDSSKASPNYMTFAGSKGRNTTLLDRNEFDGWITIASTRGKEIALPFHTILRQASDVRIANNTLPTTVTLPRPVPIDLSNKGSDVAQIDAFRLLFLGQDDPEKPRGSHDPPSVFRYIGYRIVPVNEPGCGQLLEFAIITWERIRTLATSRFFRSPRR